MPTLGHQKCNQGILKDQLDLSQETNKQKKMCKNFGDKFLHQLKSAFQVLILQGCGLLSSHHHHHLRPADVTALCP